MSQLQYTRCDRVAYAFFVAETGHTKSNWMDFMQQVAGTKFSCSDSIFH